MAKNKETIETKEIVEKDTEKTSDKKVDKKADKKEKPKKAKKEKKGGVGKMLKESISEIKKVNWPTFGKVVKQTGMVITVVAVCTLLLFGIDRLLGWIFTLIAY